jgi:hypothetical protein
VRADVHGVRRFTQPVPGRRRLPTSSRRSVGVLWSDERARHHLRSAREDSTPRSYRMRLGTRIAVGRNRACHRRPLGPLANESSRSRSAHRRPVAIARSVSVNPAGLSSGSPTSFGHSRRDPGCGSGESPRAAYTARGPFDRTAPGRVWGTKPLGRLVTGLGFEPETTQGRRRLVDLGADEAPPPGPDTSQHLERKGRVR